MAEPASQPYLRGVVSWYRAMFRHQPGGRRDGHILGQLVLNLQTTDSKQHEFSRSYQKTSQGLFLKEEHQWQFIGPAQFSEFMNPLNRLFSILLIKADYMNYMSVPRSNLKVNFQTNWIKSFSIAIPYLFMMICH